MPRMATIICGDGMRSWYRDVLVEDGELFCGPNEANDPPRTMSRPTGEYDAAAYVKSLPAPWNNPSLVFIFYDTGGNSSARNLAGLKCPKVLLAGDTHHICHPGHRPLGDLIDYCRSEIFDLVLLDYNRQHGHFFLEAGLNAAWLPCFSLTPFEHPCDTPKKFDVTFIGGLGCHPYRWHVLQSLTSAGISVGYATATQEHTAEIQSASKINLNISLNGDFNLRNLEVLAAGGLLMTDRLGAESGQSILLEDRHHCVMFDSPAECAELLRYYLARPEEAGAIARAGKAHYLHYHSPAIKRRQLFDLLDHHIPAGFDLRDDRRWRLFPDAWEDLDRRIRAYEDLQEIHRQKCKPFDFEFSEGMKLFAADASDLPRLTPVGAGANALDSTRLSLSADT